METIDAEVTVLQARWRLSADADAVELLHAAQEWLFMHESGLALGRPRAAIRLSQAVGYVELLENVQAHGYRLMCKRGEIIPPDAVAADWYDRVYEPITEGIRREGVEGVCRRPTGADLFLWIHQVRRELLLDGPDLSVDDVVRHAARGARR
jgi:hypothetical protein